LTGIGPPDSQPTAFATGAVDRGIGSCSARSAWSAVRG